MSSCSIMATSVVISGLPGHKVSLEVCVSAGLVVQIWPLEVLVTSSRFSSMYCVNFCVSLALIMLSRPISCCENQAYSTTSTGCDSFLQILQLDPLCLFVIPLDAKLPAFCCSFVPSLAILGGMCGIRYWNGCIILLVINDVLHDECSHGRFCRSNLIGCI